MGRKRRLKRERRENLTAEYSVAMSEPKQKGLNPRFDRMLTLFAFAALLIGLVLLTPLLANKQTGELKTLSAQVFSQLEAQQNDLLYGTFSSAFKEKYTPEGLIAWLGDKGLTDIKHVEKVWTQEGKSQAIVRARFEQAGQVGLLSAFFVSPPKLSLQNRWELAQICRADQQVKDLLTQFLSQLENKQYQSAYDMTADGVIKQSLYTPKAFAGHIQSLNIPFNHEWLWQPLASEDQLLVLHGTIQGKRYRIELLEKPDSCEYLILDFKKD